MSFRITSIIISFLFFYFVQFGQSYTETEVENKELINHYLENAELLRNVNNDSSTFYYKKAISIAKQEKLIGIENKIYLSLLKIEIIKGNLVDAFKYSDSLLNQTNSDNFKNDRIAALIYRGNIFQVSGLANEALKIFMEVERTIQTTPTAEDNILDLNLFIASAYQDINEIEKSNDYLLKNIELANDYLSAVKMAGTYILLSINSVSFDDELEHLNIAEIIIKKNPYAINEHLVILNNKALLFKALGDLTKSKATYLKAINMAREKGYRPYLANLYNNYAYQLMAENKTDSINFILKEAMLIAHDIKDIDLEASLLDTWSDYYSYIAAFDSALDFKNRSVTKRKEYREKQQIQQAMFLSTVFETEEKEKEIIEQQGKLNRFQSILFGSVALIIFLIGLGIYYRQKSAIRKARLNSAEQEKTIEVANALIQGQDTERKRLAMDLHDGLGARIGALRFKLEALLQNKKEKEDVENDIDRIGQNIRELSHRMQPTQLLELGLVFSLQDLFQSISASGRFSIELETDLQKRLVLTLETQLYYLVFELINNAIKHSGGNQIFVQLINHESSLSLSVEDNGKGMQQKHVQSGLGLKNIEQRISYLGGNIQIDAHAGQGTLFMIEIPLETND